MIYEFVPIENVIKEIDSYLERHYQDAPTREDYGRADIDLDAYISLSKVGRCGAVVARDKGHMVGYAVFVIGNDINHKKQIEALNTALFIDKDYRGRIINEYFENIEIFLKEYGVTKTTFILSDERLGKLLQRKGFHSKQKLWSK